MRCSRGSRGQPKLRLVERDTPPQERRRCCSGTAQTGPGEKPRTGSDSHLLHSVISPVFLLCSALANYTDLEPQHPSRSSELVSKGGVMSWESGVNEADCDPERVGPAEPFSTHPTPPLCLAPTRPKWTAWLPKHTTMCSYPAALTSLPGLHFLLLLTY